MVATVVIRRLTGTTAAQVATDIKDINTRANAQDVHSTADTTNPVQRPTTGKNFSFWVSTRLDATATPAGTIDNIRWFTDSSNNFGTGITAKGQSATTYVIATGVVGTSGDELTTDSHTGMTAPPVDIFTFTSGAPKSLTGSISNPSTGQFGDYMIYQLEADTTAGPGASNQETFTFRFDET